jgi:hypothetical protein
MYEIATCKASILRGTSTDAYGDVTDTGTVIASGIIASIRESSRTVFDPSTQTPRVIRTIDCRLPSGIDVVNTDQVRDDTYGITYIVAGVTVPRQPGFAADLEVQLKRIT